MTPGPVSDLALFDLDGTLLAGDSDFEWGAYLADIGAVDSAFYLAENERFFKLYREGALDINEYLRFALRPLADHPLDDLLAWRRAFVEQKIKPLINPGAAALLDRHAADVTAVITSTNRFITTPVANLLGVDALIATEPEVRKNRYTGEALAPPCFQEGKITCLKDWLKSARLSFDRTWFYSDSINDLPLLQFVDNPVVVDGDEALSRHAADQGWPRISLRKPA